ncbi:MAG: hypothetical protein ABJN57_10685 [Hyphomicrobiales bacterium]
MSNLYSIIIISIFTQEIAVAPKYHFEDTYLNEIRSIGIKMSYSEKLEASRTHYPFNGWRDNFKHGLEQYTEENCNKAQAILDSLISNLISLGEDAEEAQKVEKFKIAVLSLNELNDATDGSLIETGEREDLCELFDQIAKAAGIESSKYGAGEGIASQWRDW